MTAAPKLANKSALVTGAARGIGRAIAKALAAEGARVAIHYGQSGSKAERLRAEIEADGGRAFCLQADMGSVAAIQRMFTALEGQLEGPLDILVNNAAVSPTASIEQTDEAMFDRTYAINVKGPFFAIQAALPRMADGGRIVNISSMGAHRGRPHLLAYGTSKAAMDAMARSLAIQLGPRRITVNNVAPGFIPTEMNAELLKDPVRREVLMNRSVLGRLGAPEDIAKVVAFLASDDAAWITGQTLFANGGQELGG